jgi:hypothetical protein
MKRHTDELAFQISRDAALLCAVLMATQFLPLGQHPWIWAVIVLVNLLILRRLAGPVKELCGSAFADLTAARAAAAAEEEEESDLIFTIEATAKAVDANLAPVEDHRSNRDRMDGARGAMVTSMKGRWTESDTLRAG